MDKELKTDGIERADEDFIKKLIMAGVLNIGSDGMIHANEIGTYKLD